MEKSTRYIIKRSPDFTNFGVIIKRNSVNKGFSESVINNTPPSVKLKKGDIIYVAETNYGIYATGIVTEIGDNIPFNSIDEILNHFNSKEKIDYIYCYNLMTKLKNAQLKNPSSKLYFHEYFIEQKLLNKVIPLTGDLDPLKYIVSFGKIKENMINSLENPTHESINKVKSDIPGALRIYLYSFFNKKHKISTWIDIDHFVPKSIGGPGNLIENLVPIGFSLNRYKSNSIPKGLFQVANSYSELKSFVKKDFISDDKMFLSTASAKENAGKIIKVVNSWGDDKDLYEVKKFYRSILEIHHPDYYEIIKDIKWISEIGKNGDYY